MDHNDVGLCAAEIDVEWAEVGVMLEYTLLCGLKSLEGKYDVQCPTDNKVVGYVLCTRCALKSITGSLNLITLADHHKCACFCI